MNKVELLMNIIKDYDCDIEHYHKQSMLNYEQMTVARNKKAQITQLLTELMELDNDR